MLKFINTTLELKINLPQNLFIYLNFAKQEKKQQQQ